MIEYCELEFEEYLRMVIGIDASRAFLQNRTGIEEYAYRVIEHLRDKIPSDTKVILFTRRCLLENISVKRDLPKNWKIKEIGWKRLWTQGGLAWEMFWRPVDILFVPAHTVPWVHPKKTVVVVHGLEYEFCSNSYSFWDRWYMRISIWLSCRWAWRVISVSENTKKDLIRLYDVSEEKITVIYEGTPNQNDVIFPFLKKKNAENVSDLKNQFLSIGSKFKIQESKIILCIGRVEERKNIVCLIQAFDALKEKYAIPHVLVLAGKKGYGFERIQVQISSSKFRNAIIELGYVSEEEKRALLQNADIFVFPSLYEGFGLPILEAQAMSIPVVTSNISSMPEVAGDGAVLVNPYNREEIIEGIHSILSDKKKRNRMISLGCDNVQRFSWDKSTNGILKVILGE